MITPSWLSRSIRYFWIVLLCILAPFLYLFYFSKIHTVSVLCCPHLCMEYFPFYCFPLFLCIVHITMVPYLSLLVFGTLHLEGYIFLFLLCLSLLICKAFPDNHFAFLSWGWFGSLPPVQYHKPLSMVLKAFYQIYSLESICHFYCLIIRDLIQVIPEWSSGFPCFLQFKSEFCNKEFMI